MQNILIQNKPPDSEWRVKICDLGLSRRIVGDVPSTEVKGTSGLMAPGRIPGIGGESRKANSFLPICGVWGRLLSKC